MVQVRGWGLRLRHGSCGDGEQVDLGELWGAKALELDGRSQVGRRRGEGLGALLGFCPGVSTSKCRLASFACYGKWRP